MGGDYKPSHYLNCTLIGCQFTKLNGEKVMYYVSSFYGNNDIRNNIYTFPNMREVIRYVDLVREEKAKHHGFGEIQLVVSQPAGKILEIHVV